jgi:hypothetical protein
MSTETETAITKNRVILHDTDGNPWDIANSSLVAIKPNPPNTTCKFVYVAGQEVNVLIDYSVAKAAFEAT